MILEYSKFDFERQDSITANLETTSSPKYNTYIHNDSRGYQVSVKLKGGEEANT